jgi:hypothetical protein
MAGIRIAHLAGLAWLTEVLNIYALPAAVRYAYPGPFASAASYRAVLWRIWYGHTVTMMKSGHAAKEERQLSVAPGFVAAVRF